MIHGQEVFSFVNSKHHQRAIMRTGLIKKFPISIVGFILPECASVPYSVFSADNFIGIYASGDI